MSTTLEKYEITFVTEFVLNDYENQFYSINGTLSQFINGYNHEVDVCNYLLSYLDKVLIGTMPQILIQSETMVKARISNSITELFLHSFASSGNPDYLLPTDDLKEIAEAWLAYLQEN